MRFSNQGLTRVIGTRGSSADVSLSIHEEFGLISSSFVYKRVMPFQ